jgi:hypothetical protein
MRFDYHRLLPPYWLQNYPTNWEWDAILNNAMDTGKIRVLSPWTADVGGFEVWVANWPYSFGKMDGWKGDNYGLPSVATRKRLRSMLLRAIAKEAGYE